MPEQEEQQRREPAQQEDREDVPRLARPHSLPGTGQPGVGDGPKARGGGGSGSGGGGVLLPRTPKRCIQPTRLSAEPPRQELRAMPFFPPLLAQPVAKQSAPAAPNPCRAGDPGLPSGRRCRICISSLDLPRSSATQPRPGKGAHSRLQRGLGLAGAKRARVLHRPGRGRGRAQQVALSISRLFLSG